MSLKDDLIAAKALIREQSAYERLGIVGAFNAALKDKTRYGIGGSLLRRHGKLVPSFHDQKRCHEEALALFDRAIEAAP